MRAALVFPPFTDATQPYSSLPALAAAVRRAGHEALLVDANLGFVRSRLGPEPVREAAEALHHRLRRLEARRSGADAGLTSRLVTACLKAPAVADGVAAAVADLGRAETFRDLGRLSAAKRLVDEALSIHTLAWPAGLGMSSPAVPELGWPESIAAWAADPARNPFLEYLETVTLPRLEAVAPGAVALSVTYRSQVLPAFTLARLLRRRLPGVPVILGGSMVSRWHDGIDAGSALFDVCDYLVAFEGETALARLLDSLQSDGPPEEVPNVVFRRGGHTVRTPVLSEDLDALPTPDYRGLPLDDYLAPYPVFLLGTSRGCYWKRCRFCSVSPATGSRYRRRHPDRIQADFATLVERHGARCISLGDDCVAPSTLRALANRLRERGPRVSWQCETRFERSLDRILLEDLAAAGCRNLIFGLESYSPRVLASMGKGVRHTEIRRILDDCRRAGVAFNLQFFFGFPGETREEAETTAEFVAGEMRGAATFSFGIFELQKGAPVERDPAAFGIESVARDGAPLAVRYDYAPQPAHAAPVRARLRRRLEERSRHRHAGLSINAHTLLFLHEAGVEGLGGLYRDGSGDPTAEPRTPGNGGAVGGGATGESLMERPLRPVAGQHALELPWVPGGILESEADDGEGSALLLYDHATDRTVQVPRLALWLLRHLDGTATPSDLCRRLATETGESVATAATAVRGLIDGLHRRGFLH